MRFFKQKNVIEWLLPFLCIVTLLVFIYSFFSPSLPRFRLSLAHIKDELAVLLIVLFASHMYLERKKWVGAFSGRRKIHVLVFSMIFSLVLLSRLPYLVYPLTFLNADKSVTLLMVKNIAQGISFPIYFYGQFYQGSLPAYVYAFLYNLLPQLNVSVLLVNFLVYTVFVLFVALLIRKVTNKRSFFYPLLVFSLPLAGMNLFTNDMVRGIPFIVLFEFLLLYLVYQVIFEDKRHLFLIGFVGGLLYWLYLPSVGFILIAFGWLFGFLLVRKKVRLMLLSSVSFVLGFCVGNFPNILAEINNHFINTKFLIFSPRSPGTRWIFDLGSIDKIFEVIFIGLDVNKAVATVIFILFVFSFGYVLFRSLKEKSLQRIYILIVFLAGLIVLFLSGYPPIPRYLIHYRLYSFFILVIIVQALQEMKIFQLKGTKFLFLLLFAGLLVWKSGIRFSEWREIQRRNAQEIAALNKIEEKVVLGNYWDVMRLAPFMENDRLLITAPSANHPEGIFTFSKYYPAALKLGELWSKTPKAYLAPSSKSESIERLLRDFGITYSRDDLPSNRYVLYSDFPADLSPCFVEFFGSDLKRQYLAKERNQVLFIKERLAEIPEPRIQGRDITVFNPLSDELASQGWSEHRIKDWRYVLRKGNHRISFPLDFSSETTTFALPEFLSVKEGTYRKLIYFLNTPVFDYGEMDIHADFQNSRVILSHIRDSLLFTPMRDEMKRQIRGLPLERLEMTLSDPSIRKLECEVYSFLNFETTIWTNRYEQIVYVNGREYVLTPGENTITIPIDQEQTLQFDTEHRSLLLAKDSHGNIIFPNTGAVLERMKVHRDGSSISVIPFLKKDPED
jgi:hypothetical protein